MQEAEPTQSSAPFANESPWEKWYRRSYLVIYVTIRNTFICLLGIVCKYSRSLWLRKLVGTMLHNNISDHMGNYSKYSEIATPTVVVAHGLGTNVSILQCERRGCNGDIDDIFEQDITMTVIHLKGHVIVYNPIPLSAVQMREHVSRDAVHYWIVLPAVYHHIYVDAYVAALPADRISVVGSVRRAGSTTRAHDPRP